jgi:hypothetical protein
MWTRRSSQPRALPATRFNLLLLDDGEYFLDVRTEQSTWTLDSFYCMRTGGDELMRIRPF